jgi:hypothetical protein
VAEVFDRAWSIEVMNSSAVLIAMSLFMMILVYFFGRFRWNKLNVVDVYILMVSVFFGVYGFVDGLVADQSGFEPVLIIWTFVWVIIVAATTWLISQRLPKKIRSLLQIRHLTSQWAVVDDRFILFLFVTVFAITIYGYNQFRILSHMGFDNLRWINILLPYWYTSSLIFVQPILFCIFLGGTTKFFKNKGKKRLFWCLILGLTLLLNATYGRRAVYNLTFIFLILWFIEKKENLFALKNIKILILVISIFFMFSNIYQNYRPFIWSYQPGLTRTVDVPNIFESAVDTDATVTNLRDRMAMWKFNYIILDKQTIQNENAPYGEIIFQGLKNSVPRVMWPRKKIFDLDEMVSIMYGLPISDYPTNNFAMAQADFGYLSIFFLALNMFTIFFLIAIIAKKSRKIPGLVLLLTGFLTYHVISIESGYAGIFTLFRNVIVLSIIFLIGHILIRVLNIKRI